VQQPRGLLRVSAPVTMGQRHLNAMAVEFLALYPDIELELVLDDRFVDPREERIDVSLRVGGTLPPDLVARHIGTWPRVLVASPGYVAARGKPRKPPTCSCTTTCAMRPATTVCCCAGPRDRSACRCAAATA
jgi:DNA-binding transcriptional LysR family regulator